MDTRDVAHNTAPPPFQNKLRFRPLSCVRRHRSLYHFCLVRIRIAGFPFPLLVFHFADVTWVLSLSHLDSPDLGSLSVFVSIPRVVIGPHEGVRNQSIHGLIELASGHGVSACVRLWTGRGAQKSNRIARTRAERRIRSTVVVDIRLCERDDARWVTTVVPLPYGGSSTQPV